MAIAPLYNIPNDAQSLSVFSFHNQDMHRQIVLAIADTMNIILPLYPIDPVTVHDLAGWAEQHQALHADFTRVLGIVGSDFSSLDFEDPAQLSAWIFLHAAEHTQAADMLRLS
jgi:hypothetical protein